jgi:hypothetical protein
MMRGDLINPADVAGFVSGYYGVPPTHSGISKLLEFIMPDVKLAAAANPAGWKSVIPGVMAKYDSMAQEYGLGASSRQRDFDILRTSNRSDAAFAAALGRLGWRGFQHYAALNVGGTANDGDGRSGMSSVGAGDRYASTLSGRDAPLGATAAAGFARELGISPQHAGFFVGASPEMRDALRDAIRNGTPITDDKVKSIKDVRAVIGAIRSGKIKADDPNLPPSVKKIIEDMKKKGIDPAKASRDQVDKYFKDNPDALKKLKAENKRDVAKDAGLTTDQKDDKNKQAQQRVAKAAPKQKGTGAPKEKSSGLGLGG